MSKREKTTGFFAEFRKFVARGNVMDLAVGVIIGGAFSKITTSLVNDIIMPGFSVRSQVGDRVGPSWISTPRLWPKPWPKQAPYPASEIT